MDVKPRGECPVLGCHKRYGCAVEGCPLRLTTAEIEALMAEVFEAAGEQPFIFYYDEAAPIPEEAWQALRAHDISELRADIHVRLAAPAVMPSLSQGRHGTQWKRERQPWHRR